MLIEWPLSQIAPLELHLSSTRCHAVYGPFSLSRSSAQPSNISRAHPATAQTKRAVKCKNTDKVCKAAHKNTPKTKERQRGKEIGKLTCSAATLLCHRLPHPLSETWNLLATCLAVSWPWSGLSAMLHAPFPSAKSISANFAYFTWMLFYFPLPSDFLSPYSSLPTCLSCYFLEHFMRLYLAKLACDLCFRSRSQSPTKKNEREK